MIDLKRKNKAAVLAALYNNSKSQGFGSLHATKGDMTVEQAAELLEKQTEFDYLQGRVMKVDLSGDTLDPLRYDRDLGQGAAQAAVDSVEG